MQDKHDDIKKWLQGYDTPPIPEDRLEELINVSKSYMRSSESNTSSFRSILRSQLQSLTPAFWTIQIVLMGATILLVYFWGYWQVPFYYLSTVLAIVIPVIVLLGVREISKSNTYAMWEIEQSSRYQLVKIVSCRMLIIGLFDLFFVTGILMGMSHYYQQSMIGMILYGMVPFNLSCTCYMFVISKNEEEHISYHLIACMICLVVVFFFISKQQFLFESSMLWGWGVFYLLSIISLKKAVQKYLKHEKMIGELAWNLL